MAKIKLMVIGGVAIESQIVRKDGEYRVQVRQHGATWYLPADYFTDDKEDAGWTQIKMMYDYREHLNHVDNRTGA